MNNRFSIKKTAKLNKLEKLVLQNWTLHNFQRFRVFFSGTAKI